MASKTRPIRNLPAIQEYEFHAHNKPMFSGRIQRTGADLGGGEGGGVSRRVTVKSGNRRLHLAEKTFSKLPPRTAAHVVFVLNELKKLGLSTVPSVRLAVLKNLPPEKRHKEVSLIMSDLSRGGKFEVRDYMNIWTGLPQVYGLKNEKEIKAQISKETEIAARHGFEFEGRGREWLIVVDPKTKIGRPYVVDVKTTYIGRELQKKYNAWEGKLLWDE